MSYLQMGNQNILIAFFLICCASLSAQTTYFVSNSGNSNDGWRVIGTQAFANSRFLYYINEIRSAVLVMHGEKAHSRYFGEAAYHYMMDGKAEGYNVIGKTNPNPDNKQLLIIPGATHCDLYDGGDENYIPWDTLAAFFNKNM